MSHPQQSPDAFKRHTSENAAEEFNDVPAAPKGHPRHDDADAFFPDPESGPAHTADDLAQELAEQYLLTVNSGDYVAEDEFNKETPEEAEEEGIEAAGEAAEDEEEEDE